MTNYAINKESEDFVQNAGNDDAGHDNGNENVSPSWDAVLSFPLLHESRLLVFSPFRYD